MANGFISRLFTRLFATSLVSEAYAGILGREPDASGFAAHAASVRRTGRLAPVLKTMTGSDEAWRGALKGHAVELVGELQQALRGGESDSAERSNWATKVQDASDLGAAAAALSSGAMHWRLLVQRDPETLITGAFLGVLGRPPLDEEMSASKAILAEGGDIAAFIREIVSSEVHRSNVLAHTAVNAPLDGLMAFGQPILAEAYRGILGRNPDDEGLAVHASSLQQTRDLAAVLGEISRSDEAWARALQERAAEIANELRAALLGVDDHPDASGEQAPSLRSTSDLRGLVESLAKGAGHWRHLARRDAEVLVEAAYTALLQREPDAEERQNQANWLAETGDMVTFLAEIGRSDEHSMRVTESQALKDESSQTGVAVQTPNHEALIVSAFQGLLGREPDAQALAAYSTYLGETGNVAAFLAELGGSVEHRKRVLLRTAARP